MNTSISTTRNSDNNNISNLITTTSQPTFVVPPPEKGFEINNIHKVILDNLPKGGNPNNMIDSLVKQIINNYDISKSSSSSSTKPITDETIDSLLLREDNCINMSPLFNTNRCYVEDFILLTEQSPAIVLFPHDDIPKPFKQHIDVLTKLLFYCNFGSNRRYTCIKCFVFKNCDKAKAEIGIQSKPDINQAFGVQNCGIILKLLIDDTDINNESLQDLQFRISWSDILNGTTNGIQIWSHLQKLRNPKP